MPEVFRNEICKGFDAKFVAGELANRSYLLKANDQKNTQNIRVENIQQRFYVLTSNIFEAGIFATDEIIENEFINSELSVSCVASATSVT